jgi:hypothetical protein
VAAECIPDQALRENEWYNDFVVIALSSVFHQQIGRRFSDRVDSVVNLVSVPLTQAAQRHVGRFSFPRAGAAGKSGTESVVEGSRFYFHIE